MAALRDRRHEAVAQALAVMKTPAAASREAGYKDGTSFDDNARKRANRPDIRARVAELQAAQADLVEVNVEWIKLQASRVAGVQFDPSEVKPADKLAALNLLAKMTPGALVPTKIAPTTPEGEMLPIMDISDEDRARALAAFLAKTKQSESV